MLPFVTSDNVKRIVKEIIKNGGFTPGGGSDLPDLKNANNNDVLKVLKTDAVKGFYPPIELNQSLPKFYFYPNGLPETFKDYTPDVTSENASYVRFLQIKLEAEDIGVHYLNLYFVFYSYPNQGILYNMLCFDAKDTPEIGTPDLNRAFMIWMHVKYGGQEESSINEYMTQDGDFYDVYSALWGGSEPPVGANIKYTVTYINYQDDWGNFFGQSKEMREIVPAKTELEWGTPYPEIKKADQVLTSKINFAPIFEYSSKSDYYIYPVSEGQRLYFNQDLSKEEIIDVIEGMLDPSGAVPLISLTSDNTTSYAAPQFMFCKDGQGLGYCIFVSESGSSTLKQLYSTYTGDFYFTGSSSPECQVVEGWNQENLDGYISWDSSVKYISLGRNPVIVDVYGKLISLTKGKFYDPTTCSEVVWEDKDASSKLKGECNISTYSWSASDDVFVGQIRISGLTEDTNLVLSPKDEGYARTVQKAGIYYVETTTNYLKLYATEQPQNTIYFKYVEM